MNKTVTTCCLVAGLLVGCHQYHDTGSGTRRLPLHSATIPTPQDSQVWFARLKQLDEILERDHIHMVFLGDSITQGWESDGRRVWEQFYSKRFAVNFGMNRDTTENLLWRIQQGTLRGMYPHLLVLLVGVNNASQGTSPQEIADGVEAVLQGIRLALPHTTVLVLGIFPSGEQPDHPRRVKTREANMLMRGMVDRHKSVFLDIADVFLEEDGTISSEIMPDFLHLSHQGYRLWAEAIESTVQRVLGEAIPH